MQGKDVNSLPPDNEPAHPGVASKQSKNCSHRDINPAAWGADGDVWQQIRWTAARLIRHSSFAESDRADLEQELALDFWRRVDCYWDPRRGSILTFANRVLPHQAASLLRGRCAKKRSQPIPCSGELDETDLCASFTTAESKRHLGQCPIDEVELRELRHDLAAVLSKLPSELQELSRILSECSHTQAAERLGISRRMLRHRTKQLLQAFEAAGFDEPI